MDDNLTCYGQKYNKLKDCKDCQYNTYCRDSTRLEKVHVENTQKDQMDIELDQISNYAKASNISGALITELLKLTDFDPLKLYTVIMRLGGCTYKDIGSVFGISDVAVYKYCEAMPMVLKEYLKTKAITMLELEEAFQSRPEPGANHFERTLKKMVNTEVLNSQGTTKIQKKCKGRAEDSSSIRKCAYNKKKQRVVKNG